MIRVKAKIEGVSPMLMNPATDELLNELDGGAGARKPKDLGSTPDQKAEKKVIRNEKQEIGIPAEYLFSCLVEAGRLVKIDAKRSISTKESTLLPSFLNIEGLFLPFTDQSVKWKTDRRRGMLENKGKKTAVCITRPRFDQWGFSVTLSIDEDEIAEEKVKLLFDRAGSAIGLADFRPACRGPFGRFKVVKWEKISN